MERVVVADEFDLWVGRTDRPYRFMSPVGGSDFALLLVVADPAVTDDERASVSDQLVRQGCRYAVCAGHDCSRWDDAIDLAYLATDPGYSPSDERFVMTTWHQDEPLEDVVEYFRWNTVFDDFVPRHFIAMQLGGEAYGVDRIRMAVLSRFGPGH